MVIVKVVVVGRGRARSSCYMLAPPMTRGGGAAARRRLRRAWPIAGGAAPYAQSSSAETRAIAMRTAARSAHSISAPPLHYDACVLMPVPSSFIPIPASFIPIPVPLTPIPV